MRTLIIGILAIVFGWYVVSTVRTVLQDVQAQLVRAVDVGR